MQYEIKRFGTDYPDVYILYYRETKNNFDPFFYLGLDTGDKIEAFEGSIGKIREVVADSKYKSRDLGDSRSVWIEKIEAEIKERFVRNFFNEYGLIDEEWASIFTRNEITQILEKNPEYYDSPSYRTSLIFPETSNNLQSNSFFEDVPLLREYSGNFADFLLLQNKLHPASTVTVNESIVSAYLSKTEQAKSDVATFLLISFVKACEDKEYMRNILYYYTEVMELAAGLQDETSDISHWLQIREAISGKKTVKVKFRDCNELQEIFANTVGNAFHPHGLSYKYLYHAISSNCKEITSALIPTGRSFLEWKLSYNIVEWIEFRHKKIWVNPKYKEV